MKVGRLYCILLGFLVPHSELLGRPGLFLVSCGFLGLVSPGLDSVLLPPAGLDSAVLRPPWARSS